MEFKALNLNPWGMEKNIYRGDCVIRATCACTAIGYRKVCELMGVGKDFRLGMGYGWSANHGIDDKTFENFAKKTGYFTKIWEDEMFSELIGNEDADYNLPELTAEDTLGYFAENYLPFILDEKRVKGTRFLVSVRTNTAKSKRDDLKRHATAIIKDGDSWTCVDAESCRGVVNSVPTDIWVSNEWLGKDAKDFYVTEWLALHREWKEEFRRQMKLARAKSRS